MLFEKDVEQKFLKETSETENYVEWLKELKEEAVGTIRKQLEKEINRQTKGIEGEKKVIYELKHSGQDMYILRDIYLNTGKSSAQIDFLVVTRKCVYIIECKNWIGNFKIEGANFIRIDSEEKKGYYSPVEQNRKHLQVVKEVRRKAKGNFLLKKLFDMNFSSNYKSIVVFADYSNCLNMKNATDEIKEQVVRADNLSNFIKMKDALIKGDEWTKREMRKLAEFFLSVSYPQSGDYLKRIEEYKKLIKKEKSKEFKPKTSYGLCPICKQGNVREGVINGKKNYFCSNYASGCGLRIWKSTRGKELTEEQVRTLLSKGKTDLIKGFVTQDNSKRKYDANLVLTEDGKVEAEFVGWQSI